jgi:hypothetical protein
VHEEVAKEEAAVETFGALKKQHTGWHLATGHCVKLKERNQGNGGSQKKLAAACRRMTHHTEVAWHKGHSKNKARRGTLKGQMFGRRHRVKPEVSHGIRELRLQGAATSWKREDIWWGLQAGSCTGDREANSQIFHKDLKNEELNVVEGLTSFEMEKETAAHRVRARDVGAPATLVSL